MTCSLPLATAFALALTLFPQAVPAKSPSVKVDRVILVCGLSGKGADATLVLQYITSSVPLPAVVGAGESCADATATLFDDGWGSAASIDPKDTAGTALNGDALVGIVPPKDIAVTRGVVTLVCTLGAADLEDAINNCDEQSVLLFSSGFFASAAGVDPKDGGVSAIDPKTDPVAA